MRLRKNNVIFESIQAHRIGQTQLTYETGICAVMCIFSNVFVCLLELREVIPCHLCRIELNERCCSSIGRKVQQPSQQLWQCKTSKCTARRPHMRHTKLPLHEVYLPQPFSLLMGANKGFCGNHMSRLFLLVILYFLWAEVTAQILDIAIDSAKEWSENIEISEGFQKIKLIASIGQRLSGIGILICTQPFLDKHCS